MLVIKTYGRNRVFGKYLSAGRRAKLGIKHAGYRITDTLPLLVNSEKEESITCISNIE